ncbi:DUF397 domain-containing protein [Streptomyces sp. CC208A]|uniref:DUF397 domain-containing protein n=1 Tax=Streptomyces sp. CC208A TaxID=3044573 RepID=UPI0024A7F2DB|nr:DUF397 domain-containing protein [Streptomyces sp. CC208A]
MSTDLKWFKSSYSSDQQGDCVEVASCVHSVHVRDSKDTALPSLSVSPTAWHAFLAQVK